MGRRKVELEAKRNRLPGNRKGEHAPYIASLLNPIDGCASGRLEAAGGFSASVWPYKCS